MKPEIQTTFQNKIICVILLSIVSLHASAQDPGTDGSNLIQEQFSPEKYFTDSVSFTYEKCSVSIKKKKEVRNCKTHNFTARVEYNQLTIFEEFTSDNGMYNSDHLDYTYSNLADINYTSSTIKKNVEYQPVDGSYAIVTKPEEYYRLSITPKYGKGFGSVSRYFGRKGESSQSLYFNTQQDAMEALKFLENINLLKNPVIAKEPDPIIIDPSPEEIYDMLGITAGAFHEKLTEKGYGLTQTDGDTKLYCVYGSCFAIDYHTLNDPIKDIVYSTINYSYLTSVKVFCSTLIENFDGQSEFRYIWMTPNRDRKIMVKETVTDEGKNQINTVFKKY